MENEIEGLRPPYDGQTIAALGKKAIRTSVAPQPKPTELATDASPEDLIIDGYIRDLLVGEAVTRSTPR